MTKEELLYRIKDIEWDDFEAKEALDKLPANVWESVSAFSNSSGGWIVFGIKQKGKRFEVQGVNNGEKTESDFLNTLRNGEKFNFKLFPQGHKYTIDGKLVLAFFIPSSPFKPIYFGNPINTFVRSGSGDRQATEMEIAAMMRDQAFGSKSEEVISGTSIGNLNPSSLETYRNYLRQFNPSLEFISYDNERFCNRIGISVDGELTFGGLLMFGNGESVRKYIRNFWIDYIEIPGTSYDDASVRYTYRMPELDNIWECYQVIFQRLRIFADNPYDARPDGIAPDDESLLYALREGLVNLCSHADYFSAAHPTIRVFSDRIEFQNPGRFIVDPNDENLRMQSLPRNPTIIRLFRHAKLSENGGYGFYKMLQWKRKTGKDVVFRSDLMFANVIYYRQKLANNGGLNGGLEAQNVGLESADSKQNSMSNGGMAGGLETQNGGLKIDYEARAILTTRQSVILKAIEVRPSHTAKSLSDLLHLAQRTIERELAFLRTNGFVDKHGSKRFGIWIVLK